MPKILIAGGTGLIGSNLVKKLKQRNFEIVLLSTQKARPNNVDSFYWNPEMDIFPLLDLKTIDACINFCGAGIFDQDFSPERKDILLRSRVLPIQFLAKQFKKAGCKVPYFISASGTGIYPGICLNELDEDSTAGEGFIPELVTQWEEVIGQFSEVSNKVCIIRIGIVLSAEGGFLHKLAAPIRYFAGAVPGSGKQVISWIHIGDLTDLIIWCMDEQLEGTYNAAAPQPETLSNITRITAKTLGRPLILPKIPVWLLKMLFGKERHQLLLTSQVIDSKKIRFTGFSFKFFRAKEAIQSLLKK
jgi:uncharacterized protein (TIGR01777 family)